MASKTSSNLDPRDICIQPIYDPTLPMKANCPITGNIVNSMWTYDARRGACIQTSMDCHAPLTQNAFSSPKQCGIFCNRISLPNMTLGIHKIDPTWTTWPWLSGDSEGAVGAVEAVSS